MFSKFFIVVFHFARMLIESNFVPNARWYQVLREFARRSIWVLFYSLVKETMTALIDLNLDVNYYFRMFKNSKYYLSGSA